MLLEKSRLVSHGVEQTASRNCNKYFTNSRYAFVRLVSSDDVSRRSRQTVEKPFF